MNCLDTQGLITKYINDELAGVQLEDFLVHIDKCPDCREELEIYFIIMKGMQQLGDDDIQSYNFSELFQKKLDDSKKELSHSNKNYLIKIIVLDILIILVAVMMTSDFNSGSSDLDNIINYFNGLLID